MTCDQARELILEAEPIDLLESRDTPLSRHLEDCAPCRALARRIGEVMELLNQNLGVAPGAPGLEALRELARTPGRSRRSWRPALSYGIPLAAAAAAAVLLLARPHPPIPPPSDARQASIGADVTILPGTQAMILKTANPNITVVWFFQGEVR